MDRFPWVQPRCIRSSHGLKSDPRNRDETLVSVEYSSFSNASQFAEETLEPQSRHLPLGFALGAVSSYKHRIAVADTRQLGGSWCWSTPEGRKEEMTDQGHGVKLPSLTLTVRGHRLLFSVKESSVPGEGYGVFLRSIERQVFGNEKAFELEPGFFIDLGVYVPFRDEYKKPQRVFFVKNYFHSFKCEKHCVNTGDEGYVFDITDDVTGEPHEAERPHVLSYVNGCQADKAGTIRAEIDPEGNVHYLLGVAEGKKLSLPGNGVEIELKMRKTGLRHGEKRIHKSAQVPFNGNFRANDNDCLGALDSFTVEELSECVERFNTLLVNRKSEAFSANGMDVKTVRRAFDVCRRLETRARTLRCAALNSVSSLVRTVFEDFRMDSHLQDARSVDRQKRSAEADESKSDTTNTETRKKKNTATFVEIGFLSTDSSGESEDEAASRISYVV